MNKNLNIVDYKTLWILVATFCLTLVSTQVSAQDNDLWVKHSLAGAKAYQEGRYADAEQFFEAALKEAERFGEEDSRLGTSLYSLGLTYQNQSKFAEARVC